MADHVLQLRGLGMTFPGGIEALADVELVVLRGEFLTIVGASGSGKSTLLRLMAGLETPTQGTVERSTDAARQGGTAMVFQDPALMAWASVFDNVWLPLRIAGQSRKTARERIDDVLQTVGLYERRDALPRDLSGGMRMRVSIARALVTQPRLILLDEPFAALDEITRYRLNDVLLELWRQNGLTAVLVTHSVFESAYLSTRIVALTTPPAQVFGEVSISADIPRNTAFRQSAGFLDYARKVSALLEQAG